MPFGEDEAAGTIGRGGDRVRPVWTDGRLKRLAVRARRVNFDLHWEAG